MMPWLLLALTSLACVGSWLGMGWILRRLRQQERTAGATLVLQGREIQALRDDVRSLLAMASAEAGARAAEEARVQGLIGAFTPSDETVQNLEREHKMAERGFLSSRRPQPPSLTGFGNWVPPSVPVSSTLEGRSSPSGSSNSRSTGRTSY